MTMEAASRGQRRLTGACERQFERCKHRTVPSRYQNPRGLSFQAPPIGEYVGAYRLRALHGGGTT